MTRIDSVDLYYLSMPKIELIGDGSQDVLLVRVRAGEWEGWGECEAAPLVSIASFVAPMSHIACQPVARSVIGETLDDIADVRRINAKVRANSFDQLQAAHTLSGIDIAMCDLLGRRYEAPVHELLGAGRPTGKVPYASTLFGESPEDTFAEASRLAALGYRAVKFGWMGFGEDLATDRSHLSAAREGLGDDVDLLVDAGMAWTARPAEAIRRLPALRENRVRFIEEPFVAEEYGAYVALRSAAAELDIAVAGGEGCHNVPMATALMDSAGLDIIQIDTGRIGGITSARDVADAARERGRAYVNHTFTSHLALSASLQPFADHPEGGLCEYPVSSKAVSFDLTREHIERDGDGLIRLPDGPGLGLDVDLGTVARYVQQVEVRVGENLIYQTPDVDFAERKAST